MPETEELRNHIAKKLEHCTPDQLAAIYRIVDSLITYKFTQTELNMLTSFVKGMAEAK